MSTKKLTFADVPSPWDSAAKRYIEYLEKIFGLSPELYLCKASDGEPPGVTAIVFRDVPEAGMTTSFTYGLSIVNHPKWIKGRPELCISVDSPLLDWAFACAELAFNLRGNCPFSYGETIKYPHAISSDSEMDAFFVFAPSTIGKSQYLGIDVGKDYLINISNLYPMYSTEIDTFQKIGLKDFWHHPHFDNYDIKRKKIIV